MAEESRYLMEADAGGPVVLDPFEVTDTRIRGPLPLNVLGSVQVTAPPLSTVLGVTPTSLTSVSTGVTLGTGGPNIRVGGQEVIGRQDIFGENISLVRDPITGEPTPLGSKVIDLSTTPSTQTTDTRSTSQIISETIQSELSRERARLNRDLSKAELDALVDRVLAANTSPSRNIDLSPTTGGGGPGQFPLILPLPIDPALAAALTAAGVLLGSGGGGGAPSGSTSGATGATTGSTGPTGGSTGPTGANTGAVKGPRESTNPQTGGPGQTILIGSIITRPDGDYRVEQDENGQIIYVPVNRPSGPTGPTGPTGPGGEPSGPGSGVIFVGSGPTGVLGGYTGPFEGMPDESWNVNPEDSCPTPEMTILMSDGSSVPAGDVRPGMWVYTAHEHTGKWGSFKVVQASIHQAERLKIDTERGAISCSTSHKFKTYGGWIEAKDVKVGSVISDHRVIAVEPIGPGDVVSLTVDDAHTYVCEGLLSHNKTPIEEIGIIPVVRPSGPTGPTGSTGSIQFTINPAVATPITVKTPDLNRDLLREGRISSPALKETAASTISNYGALAGQPGQYDIQAFQNLIGLLGDITPQLTKIATEQTVEGNRAIREASLADVQRLSPAAMEAYRAANPELYSTLGTYLPAATGMLASDLDRLRQGGRLTAEEVRSAQQSAREAGLARGREMDQSSVAAEVLNRDALSRAREAQARANVQQSMQNVYGGIGAAQAAAFNPFANLLGAQYGMQTANVGTNQALFGQGTGFTSGQFSNPFVQALLNPYSAYAQDVYGSNFNAANARAITEAMSNAAAQGANQQLIGNLAGQVFQYTLPSFLNLLGLKPQT